MGAALPALPSGKFCARMKDLDTKIEKLAFLSSGAPEADAALKRLTGRYGNHTVAEADCVVALGGDGFLLRIFHDIVERKIPVYGMNCGSLGFLLNDYNPEDLLTRINRSQAVRIGALKMKTVAHDGSKDEALAFNEVSLYRETRQTAKIRVVVDDIIRMPELVCDGILLSTPAGSTAYNFSAHGPIIPLNANVLAMTPISAFRPRRWRGAILHHESTVRFDVLEIDKRPVSATADFTEVRNIAYVEMAYAPDKFVTLLFDPDRTLEERIIQEQFAP